MNKVKKHIYIYIFEVKLDILKNALFKKFQANGNLFNGNKKR